MDKKNGAREHTIEALDVFVQIMLNEKAPPNARVAAANTLLDCAYGKAPTFSTSDTQAFKRAIDMTDDELAAIVGRAKLTLVTMNAWKVSKSKSDASAALSRSTAWCPHSRMCVSVPSAILRV